MSGFAAPPPKGLQYTGPREENEATGKLVPELPSTAPTASVVNAVVLRSAGRRMVLEVGPSLPAAKTTTTPAVSMASIKLQS